MSPRVAALSQPRFYGTAAINGSTKGSATPQDDAESIASRGSGPSRGLATAPPPHNRLILPARWGRGPFEIARRTGQHHDGPLQRGIESPLEAQRLVASGGWTSHKVLRAPDAGLGRDEPTTVGPALKHLQLLRGHAGDGPAAYRTGPLLKPQATETSWNVPDQRLAALWQAITHDDARESFASCGSAYSRPWTFTSQAD